MAVLVEGISVLVREDAINDKVEGGWRRFRMHVPNATLCYDGELARVGFLEPAQVRAYIEELEDLGLIYMEDEKPIDIVVCDQQRGPMVDCDWLQFARIRFGKGDGQVAMAWLWLGSSRGFGMHMPAKGLNLHTPRGWEFEGSLSDQYRFVPENLLSQRRDN